MGGRICAVGKGAHLNEKSCHLVLYGRTGWQLLGVIFITG